MSEPAAPAVCYRHSNRETYISCQRCGRPICPDCMRSASVGFQCPECVKEGSKATRSGRTAYGGQRSANPALTTQVLVGINLAVFVLIVATGWGSSAWVTRLGLVPDVACTKGNIFGCFAVQEGVAHGSAWQLLTSMFTHVQLWHIGFNMAALWVLGPQLELAIGRSRFLALYFLSGLGASATTYWLAGPHSLTIGASGAIFGLMAALLVIAYKVVGNIQAMYAWIAGNVIITIIVPNVSWSGHLGGFVTGGLIGAALVYAPKDRRSLFQSLAFAGVSFLVAVAIVVRTAVLLQ
jgi:membrane associated rhomboid family serine protease